LIPEGSDALTVTGIGGRRTSILACRIASSADLRRDGAQDLALPALGSVDIDGAGVFSGVTGAWSKDEVAGLHVVVQPPSVYRCRYAADRLVRTSRMGPRCHRYVTDRVWRVARRYRGLDVHHHASDLRGMDASRCV
jgi:hypothetical protein